MANELENPYPDYSPGEACLVSYCSRSVSLTSEVLCKQDATQVVFRNHESGDFIDWHIAPRRQYIITLAGGVEIGLGDGTVYHLGPGDVMLAEDLTGQGHTTRAVGDETRISVAIPLD